MKNYYTGRVKSVLILCLLLFTYSASQAQVSTYAFSASSGTYTPITGGTVLGTATNDDQNFTALPIGFSFTYNGTAYTTFSVNANGFIAMGGAVASSYTVISATTNNVVAALNRDLQGNVTTGELSYLTIGSAPNRTLVVQWTSYRKYNVTGDDFNFQIRLNESGNTVETTYGTMTSNATTATPQVGLRGGAATDFNIRTSTTSWAASAAGAANSATMTVSTTVFPASGTIYRWTGPPSTPPTPTQDPAPPTCSAGTTLTAAGTPETNVAWYWQTSATGTSLAIPYAGPYAVFANGTYYLRAYNSTASLWSLAASSYAVTNFPLATPPPAPTAAQNPACVTTGTTITAAAPPAGYQYFWQGTTVNGTSNAMSAATPFPVTTSGTYTISAYETATQCWSNTTGLAVTIETYVPAAPTTSMANYNICSGVPSLMIDATPPPGGAGGTTTTSFGTSLSSTGTTAVTFNITAPTLPVGAVITSAQLQLTNVNSINGSWRSEIRVATSGIYTLAPTQISTLSSGGAITPNPVINLTGFPITGGTLTLLLNETYDDGGVGVVDATFGEVALVLTYTQNPVSTLTWYNAATAGTMLGNTSPFEAVGTSVLPTTNTAGAYNFYAGAQSGTCQSAGRTQITVNVTEVLAALNPVNVTCNGGINGSFTLGTVQCGTAPFTYSVNGGAFGPIPTNLAAGTYSVVMKDAVPGTSAPITVVITEPAIPAALALVDANYFNAQVSWTTTGNETSWIVEYGPAGFTPGSGTFMTVNATTANITGLNADTDYSFYVAADCGPVHNYAGPFNFSTNVGFFTFDNQCGPGFTDISATGTALNLADDQTTLVTSSFPLSLQGITSDQITISNNGYITFGGVTLNAWNIDLDSEEGNVYYETVNIAGTNFFIVQWDDRPRFSAITGQLVTFQLLVNQATGEIYYAYDDVIFGGSQSGNDYGLVGTISVSGPQGTTTVSSYNATYLTNNTCAHFYSALCPNAANAGVDLIYADDAILDWDAGLYGESNWTLIYGLAGFDPTVAGAAIDTLDLTSSDASFGSTLTQLTEYDVYIYSECQADNLTSPGTMLTFTTLPYCSNPSGFAASTDVDSLETTWTWVGSSSDYPVTSYNLQYGFAGFDLNTGTEVVANGTNSADTTVNAGFLAGGVYEVYVQAVCADVVNGGTDTSSFVGPIQFIMPLTNDDVCGAEMLVTNGTVYTFSNAGATPGAGEAAIAPPATGAQTTTGWTNSTLNNTTWFTFVAPASGSVRVDNTAINYNGQAAVYEATDCGDYSTFTLLAANDNAIGGTSVAPNYTICGLTAGNTYYLLNDGFNGTTGNYSVSITPIVLEAGTAAAVSNICTGDDIDLFTTVTGNNTGGVWSSNIPAVNVSITGSDFTSEGLAPQTFTLQYRMTDGCAYDSVLTMVHVYPLSTAGANGSITACLNEPINLLSGLSGNADLTGDWYNPAGTLMANSQVSVAAVAGQFNYQYIAGNGVCADDTAQVVVNVVNTCNFLSVDEAIFTGVSVYPNPSEGIVFISSDATEAFDYVITDAKGRVVSTATAGIKGAATTEINLSAAETGIYFIRLTNASAEKTFRVVIQ